MRRLWRCAPSIALILTARAIDAQAAVEPLRTDEARRMSVTTASLANTHHANVLADWSLPTLARGESRTAFRAGGLPKGLIGGLSGAAVGGLIGYGMSLGACEMSVPVCRGLPSAALAGAAIGALLGVTIELIARR